MNTASRVFLAIVLSALAPLIWSSSEQTIEQWGKEHYEAYGKHELRMFPADSNYAHYVWFNPDLLLAYVATIGDGQELKSCHGDYVRNYPDLMAYYSSSANRVPIEVWGKWHYQILGKAEKRVSCVMEISKEVFLLKRLSDIFLLSTSESCYGDYVRSDPDLWADYSSLNYGLPIGLWGELHYKNYGKAENRIVCKAQRLREMFFLTGIIILLTGAMICAVGKFVKHFSRHYIKLEKLLYLSIAVISSSLINLSFGRIQLSYLTGSNRSDLIILILAVGIFSFMFRWLWIKQFNASLGTKHNLVPNIQNLGILLFCMGVFYGPSVTMYVIVCYLTFAPLFADNDGLIKLDNLCICIAFGFLVSGLIYVLTTHIDGDRRLVFFAPFFVFAAINMLVHKDRLVPVVSFSSYPSLIILCLLFAAFGGSVLMGSLLMGFGEYPAMFFNVDTPVRLTHAYELLNAKTYPPEMLSLKGFSMFYHYGGPAAVAALSAVTQLAVHKSMFHVVLPILIIGSFSAIHLLCRSVFRKRIYRYVSISLFLPFVYLGTELFVRVFSDHDGGGLTETLMSIGREFIWLEDYHQEKFSKGILDVSQTAGVFLLILASSLLVKRQNISVLICAPLLVVLAAFSKLAIVPAICSLLGVRVFTTYKYLQPAKFFGYVAVSGGLVMLSFYVLSVFDATRSGVQIGNLYYLYSNLTENVQNKKYAVELIFVTCFTLLCLIVSFIRDRTLQNTKLLLLSVGALGCMFTCFLAFSFIEVFNQFQIYQPVWICLPLICIAIISTSSGFRFSKTILFVVIGPLFITALMGGWVKLQQLYVTTRETVEGHEYIDNGPMALALQRISKGGNLIATNHFRYRTKRSQQYQMTALFGHQAYAVDTLHLRHNKKLQAIAAERIREQGSALNRLPNGFFTESSANFLSSVAKKNGWTHILLKKERDGYDLVSPVVSYGQTEDKLRTKSTQNNSNRSALDFPDNNYALLRRVLNDRVDLVGCGLNGLSPDGSADNVFIFDIRLPDNIIAYKPTISFIKLYRDTPPKSFNTLKFRNTGDDSVLGVGIDDRLVLINSSKGEIQIALLTNNTRLLLFSCTDTEDDQDARYFAQATVTFPSNDVNFNSSGPKFLRKTFENYRYKVYEF